MWKSFGCLGTAIVSSTLCRRFSLVCLVTRCRWLKPRPVLSMTVICLLVAVGCTVVLCPKFVSVSVLVGLMVECALLRRLRTVV